jgi:hypothetical protein
MRIGKSVIARFGVQRFGDGLTLNPIGVKRLAQAAGLAALLGTLPGCQSITGNPSLSQVRIIDASPDAPGLDVYQGSSVLAYNLGFGTVTSYVPIAPGGYPIIVDTAGTRQQLVTASGTFLANAQYTVLVGNYAATLQELILKDQSQPAPTGDISLRFIDQSVRNAGMDIYLVPSGSTLAGSKPVLTDVTFNTNSGYLNIPAGTYTLVAVATGTIPSATATTLYSGAAVAYPGGSAKTIVLIDTVVTTIPGIQVVTASDYDSTNEGS